MRKAGRDSRGTRRRILVASLAAGASLAAAGSATGASSFSFLRYATDQLAMPGYSAGSEITPEGDLYSGFAEVAIRVGAQRLHSFGSYRTLEDGRSPVYRSREVRDGPLRYVMTTFAMPVAGRLVNFVRISVRNVSGASTTGRVVVGAHYVGGQRRPGRPRPARFARPATPERSGLYFQPGVNYNNNSRFRFRRRAVLRDGTALLFFPPSTATVRLSGIVLPGGQFNPVGRDTLFGVTDSAVRLGPGGSATLDFRMPVLPVAPGAPGYGKVAYASYDVYHRRVLAFWQHLFGRATQIALPEPKVQNAFYANLAYDVMARYRLSNGLWVQAVNNMHYHAFWLRDGSIISNAYDQVGLHDLARTNLEFFLTWQRADGLFISRPDELDGFGQALWAFGEHFRRTNDRGFARHVFPAIQRAMAWFEHARGTDPLHLIPAADRPDNEDAKGHITGDNFWAAAGVDGAVAIANALGQTALRDRWLADLADFKAALDVQVRAAAARTGGWIPPVLDAPNGQIWGELWASYPYAVYSPTDQLVSTTLYRVRTRFREGIATYKDGTLLHDYLGFRVFETELLRGQQRSVIRGLYDELAHTTATNGGFESNVGVHGDRRLEEAKVPHGWFAAEYVTLLRNMLVREQGRDVYLMSVLSPTWLAAGKVVSVRRAPTTRGPIDFTLTSNRKGAVLTWRARVHAGTRLLWPVPDWVRAVRSRGLSADHKTIRLPGRSGKLVVHWHRTGAFDSYDTAVKRLLKTYRRH